MIKIFLETYGCSTNISDSEVMAGLLEQAGFMLVDRICDADVIIINICSVKLKTQYKTLTRARNLMVKYPHKKLIFAGCLSDNVCDDLMRLIKKNKSTASFVDTHNIGKIVEVTELLVGGKSVEIFGKKDNVKICLPKKRKNQVISIVPISSGCVSSCSYCIVSRIKGGLFSYPVEDILREIHQSIDSGCREIWLTSQDTAAYGLDVQEKSALPALLEKISSLNGDFKVRVGMMNPNHVITVLDELISAFKSDKVFKFLHLPVQSGNDTVLNNMDRKYSIKEFKNVVKTFRKTFPMITVATDIICGFPGETEEQFDDTLKLTDQIKPDVCNISRYGALKGTKAALMKQVPGIEIKERSKKMTVAFQKAALETNKKWIGWKGKIIIDEKGKNSSSVGRNLAYKPVIIEGSHPLGKEIKVEITDVTSFDLRAIVYEGSY